MEDITKQFGECGKVLHYFKTEYKYNQYELKELMGIEELFQYLLHMELLNPEDQDTEKLMRTAVDNFFFDQQSRKRRRQMLLRNG